MNDDYYATSEGIFRVRIEDTNGKTILAWQIPSFLLTSEDPSSFELLVLEDCFPLERHYRESWNELMQLMDKKLEEANEITEEDRDWLEEGLGEGFLSFNKNGLILTPKAQALFLDKSTRTVYQEHALGVKRN